jgi:hypothetical protein
MRKNSWHYLGREPVIRKTTEKINITFYGFNFM